MDIIQTKSVNDFDMRLILKQELSWRLIYWISSLATVAILYSAACGLLSASSSSEMAVVRLMRSSSDIWGRKKNVSKSDSKIIDKCECSYHGWVSCLQFLNWGFGKSISSSFHSDRFLSVRSPKQIWRMTRARRILWQKNRFLFHLPIAFWHPPDWDILWPELQNSGVTKWFLLLP